MNDSNHLFELFLPKNPLTQMQSYSLDSIRKGIKFVVN